MEGGIYLIQDDGELIELKERNEKSKPYITDLERQQVMHRGAKTISGFFAKIEFESGIDIAAFVASGMGQFGIATFTADGIVNSR